MSVITHDPIPDVRALLDDTEFTAVAATVVDSNKGMDVFTAGRIVTEALAFVATAARNPAAPIAPSRTVDEGWHALILHTALYARLCDSLGSFVHHYPERPDPTRWNPDVIDRTLTLIRSVGYTPDLDLWRSPGKELISVAADCSHTPIPGGCGPIGPEGPRHCNSGG